MPSSSHYAGQPGRGMQMSWWLEVFSDADFKFNNLHLKRSLQSPDDTVNTYLLYLKNVENMRSLHSVGWDSSELSVSGLSIIHTLHLYTTI